MMKRWLVLGWLLAIGVAVTTRATSTEPSSYLVIDGRWYPIANTAEVEFFQESAAMAVTETAATGCQRSGGGLPPLGSWTLYYGPTLSPLQLTGQLEISMLWDGRAALHVTTTTGDVVCAGEVEEPLPPEPPEPPVFEDDFEAVD